VRYSLCWLVFPFVAFSICSGKLATYVLPCFPPIAILGAIAFSRYFENDGKRIFNITAKVFGFIMIIGGVGFAIVQTVSACGMFRAVYDSSEIYKWIIACTAAVVWGVLSLFSAGASGGFRKIMLFGAGVALPLLAAHFCAPNLALHGKAQGIFYSKYKDLVKPDSIVVAYPNVMHAGMWEFKRNDILLYIHEGELEYGVKNYADSKDRAVSKAEFLDLLKKTPEGKIVFIMRGDFRDGNIPPAKVEKYEHGLMFFIY
jgi:4-amino-4-deoxy-L-arabinose transferase